ncbi:MAG: hypothetical protein IPO08_23695 [Xanthomonadales bacterium]|nr:hypothetical protein [Xanthomonadales bacterium]
MNSWVTADIKSDVTGPVIVLAGRVFRPQAEGPERILGQRECRQGTTYLPGTPDVWVQVWSDNPWQIVLLELRLYTEGVAGEYWQESSVEVFALTDDAW